MKFLTKFHTRGTQLLEIFLMQLPCPYIRGFGEEGFGHFPARARVGNGFAVFAFFGAVFQRGGSRLNKAFEHTASDCRKLRLFQS